MYTKQQPTTTVSTKQEEILYRYGVPYKQYSTPYGPYTTSSGSITGVYLPNFRSLIRKGSNATTDMSATEYRASFTPMTGMVNNLALPRYTQFVYLGRFDGSLPAEPSDLLDAARNQARIYAWKQLESSMKGLVALGELKETLHMIRNPARAFRSAISGYYQKMKARRAMHYRKPRYKGQRGDFIRMVSDSWLEFSFGWRPTLSDIQAGLDAYRKIADEPVSEGFFARAKEQDTIPQVQYGPYGWNYSSYVILETKRRTATYQYKGAAKTSIWTNSAVAEFGLMPSEFVPAAYELMPYSWIIDYFSTVGDVLNSWATAQRVGTLWVSSTGRTIRSVQRITKWNPDAPTYLEWSGSNGIGTVSQKDVERTFEASMPLPDFRASFRLNLSKFINLAALYEMQSADRRWRPPRI